MYVFVYMQMYMYLNVYINKDIDIFFTYAAFFQLARWGFSPWATSPDAWAHSPSPAWTGFL